MRARFHQLLVDSGLIEPLEDFVYGEYLSEEEVVVIEKSRQVGMSFAMSMRALCDAMMSGQSWLIFSESKEEARRKLGYIRHVVERLESLGFDTGLIYKGTEGYTFRSGGEVRVFSYGKSRGRGFSGSLLIDECFWIPSESLRELLLKVNPARLRVHGVLRLVGSSGYKGHYLYDGYRCDRWSRYPWWNSAHFCTDVEGARREAGKMTTHQRVYRYGKPGLVGLYEEYSDEVMFRLEMECEPCGLADGLIDYELLMSLVDETLESDTFHGLVGYTELMERLQQEKDRYYVGVDIGRRHHTTEIVFVDWDYSVRYLLTLSNTSFEDQATILQTLLSSGVVHYLTIDGTGLGMDLAERLLRNYGDSRVNVVYFTAESKREMVYNFLRFCSTKRLRFAPLHELFRQILDLRVEVSRSGHLQVYSSTKRHNGDKFWALCLALYPLRGFGLAAPASEFHGYPLWESGALGLTRIDRLRAMRRTFAFFEES